MDSLLLVKVGILLCASAVFFTPTSSLDFMHNRLIMYLLLVLLALVFLYDISLFIVAAIAFLIIVVKMDMVEVRVKYSMREMFEDPTPSPDKFLPPAAHSPAVAPSPAPQRCYMKKVCQKLDNVPELETTMPMGIAAAVDGDEYSDDGSSSSYYDDSDDSTSYYADSEDDSECD